MMYARLFAFLIGCTLAAGAVAQVSTRDLEQAGAGDEGSEWLTHGRDYAETRFSPLQQIHTGNVHTLGVAWTLDTASFRGLEATPLVRDGVMYATLSWSVVIAVDARTGELLWRHDPGVDRSMGWKACCDVVNRGVALFGNLVYVGTIDGRLIALNALDGEPEWQVQTTDVNTANTITGAPRIAEGRVIIGNGGGELGSRGYVTAYDALSGEQAWRFWVVPGNPAEGFENEDVAFAASTWHGQWWQYGGGGNAWDSIIYDPETRLVYVGTGNGSPWSHLIRSDGEGDNLYLSSIVALDIEDGSVAWYYQTTPAENFDYTATQNLVMADLEIYGELRKVVMQAPKNGFFYVLDRLTGELLSAEPYARVTWASGVDLASGRPVETLQARYGQAISTLSPSPIGAHNWHPMSFNPQTGLVYIPSQQGTSFAYAAQENFEFTERSWNRGILTGSMTGKARLPDSEYEEGTGPEYNSPGVLLAWDPVLQRARWQAEYPNHSNGGTLTTAGNLVFQGTADGRLVAYSADAGEQLWEVTLGPGILAPPVTYAVDGRQYLSVLAGWGGTTSLFGFNPAGQYRAEGRLWTFELGGESDIRPVIGQQKPALTPIRFNNEPAILELGSEVYASRCAMCHGGNGSSGGAIADLRYASEDIFASFHQIVREGAYAGLGMPDLGEVVTEAEAEAVKQYLLSLRAGLLQQVLQ